MTAILDFLHVILVLNRFKINQKQTKHAKIILTYQMKRKKRSQDQERTPRSRSGGKDVCAFDELLKLSCRF